MTRMVERRTIDRQKNKNSKTKEEGKDGKKNGITKKNDGNIKEE